MGNSLYERVRTAALSLASEVALIAREATLAGNRLVEWNRVPVSRTEGPELNVSHQLH